MPKRGSVLPYKKFKSFLRVSSIDKYDCFKTHVKALRGQAVTSHLRRGEVTKTIFMCRYSVPMYRVICKTYGILSNRILTSYSCMKYVEVFLL